MYNKTFNRIGIAIDDFVRAILDEKPDYIVPVQKKGCKLLKYCKIPSEDLAEVVRYKDFFENINIDLIGKRVSILDDATKYTSMLYRYRSYFEEKGAIVKTYSYVGHERLKSGEREQYDTQAQIQKYIEESAYQEYLIQQSRILALNSNFFDIDHLVVKAKMSLDNYEKLLNSLCKVGEIEIIDDLYTAQNIEKISLLNIDYYEAEKLFNHNVSQGALQKIRIVYNIEKEEIFIAALSFPNWDSKGDNSGIFDNIPFEVPYEHNDYISNEGIYFNIVYAFQLILLKYFFECLRARINVNDFAILEYDLRVYIGKDRATSVIKSALDFLRSKSAFKTEEGVIRKNVIVPRKAKTPFYTISDLMKELREHYNKLVKDTRTLLGVRYFLAYEEIIERYKGNENILKWIDILCDRGVIVTRNYNEDGIYYRACRSGELDFDSPEGKSGAIIVTATNACGVNNKSDKQFCRIATTYLNKVLANFIYDYPREEYGTHTLFDKPYNYGPLVYIEDKIEGNAEIPLYAVDKITSLCSYDSSNKNFVALSVRNKEVEEELKERLKYDDIPYAEISAYLGFLKYVKEQSGSDSFLNSLSICRDEESYFKYVFHNVNEAYRYVTSAEKNKIGLKTEKLLRRAAALTSSANTKLKYNQCDVMEFIAKLEPDFVYEAAKQKILDSFVPFEKDFYDRIIPLFKQVTNLEYMLENIMLFKYTNDLKYWYKMYRRYIKQNDICCNVMEELNDLVSEFKCWDEEKYIIFKEGYKKLFFQYAQEIREKLLQLQSYGHRKNGEIKRKREKTRAVNNIINYVWKQRYNNVIVLYFTYMGYENLNDEKEVDVVKTVQKVVAKNYEGGKLICGAEENGFGLYVTDALENAIDFAKNLLTISKMLNNVFFRFGCAYRVLPSENLKLCIEEALNDAQNCTVNINYRHAFIMSKQTYYNIQSIERADVIKLYRMLHKGDREYYEYEGISAMNPKVKRYETNTDEKIKIGIITVLLEEYTSMAVMLEDTQEVEFSSRGAGHQFLLGNITACDGGIHEVVLARATTDGNNKAAIRAAKMLEHFPNLEVIFMVGIAGGTPAVPSVYGDSAINHLDKHVRLGDIVVSNGIFQYDYVKEGRGKFIFKGNNIPPCAKVVEAQQRLEEILELKNDESAPWNLYIKEALDKLKSSYVRPDSSTDELHNYNGEFIEHPIDTNRSSEYPKIFTGKIASSNTVLKNPEKRDMLKREHDVYAVEMETSGIADATWEAGIGYYGVRGICDYCDDYKNDIWHKYAAVVAAAYTKALIERIPS